jgi:hypothetical protein
MRQDRVLRWLVETRNKNREGRRLGTRQRGDLTVAMRADGPTDQRVRSAAERIIAAARKVRKPVCILVGNAKETADWRSLGANSIIVASDQGFMRQAAARTRTEFSELVGAECRHWQVGTAAEIPSNYELHPKA